MTPTLRIKNALDIEVQVRWFFDVNPGKRRVQARYQTYTRFSFGPEMEQLEIGLDALERVIASTSPALRR